MNDVYFENQPIDCSFILWKLDKRAIQKNANIYDPLNEYRIPFQDNNSRAGENIFYLKNTQLKLYFRCIFI